MREKEWGMVRERVESVGRLCVRERERESGESVRDSREGVKEKGEGVREWVGCERVGRAC